MQFVVLSASSFALPPETDTAYSREDSSSTQKNGSSEPSGASLRERTPVALPELA